MKKAKRQGPMYVNKLYPGRFNYTGPQRGFFALLHHGILYESAEYTGVSERVEYIKRHKPDGEVAVRLHCIVYLGKAINDRINAGKGVKSDKVLAYLDKHVPDHSWSRGSLRFKDGTRFTG